MKYSLFFLIVLALTACTSNGSKQGNFTSEDAEKMHLKIERSHPDTVNEYINHVIEKKNLETNFSSLSDGSYKAVSPADDFKYTHTLQVEIKNGKIVSAHYDENGEDGHSKKDDAEYNRKMKESTGSCPVESYPFYEKQLLEKQNLDDIDALSGSTYSLYRMKLAGLLILNP